MALESEGGAIKAVQKLLDPAFDAFLGRVSEPSPDVIGFAEFRHLLRIGAAREADFQRGTCNGHPFRGKRGGGLDAGCGRLRSKRAKDDDCRAYFRRRLSGKCASESGQHQTGAKNSHVNPPTARREEPREAQFVGRFDRRRCFHCQHERLLPRPQAHREWGRPKLP